MRDMLFIIILSAEQELHSLGGSVCERKESYCVVQTEKLTSRILINKSS